MSWITGILSIFKALPILKDIIEIFTGWFSSFKKWNTKRKFENTRRDIDEGFDKAKEEKNTEDLTEELEDLL